MTIQPLRVAHIGPIAQNAYNGAKFQRRLGVKADSFDLGGGQPMWVPWWEDDPDLDPAQLQPSHYDWLSVAQSTGFRRPPWAKILGVLRDAPWYDTQEDYHVDFPRLVSGAVHGQPGQSQRASDEEAADALATSRLTPDEQRQCVRALRDVSCWQSVREIARHYDLLVLYGPFASAAVALPSTVPYITFEHSTMRMVPLLDTPDRLALAAAYRHADHNILTNADCREAAWCLGLDSGRLSFIPHPIDTDFFTPQPDDQSAVEVRERLLNGAPDPVLREQGGAELVFFAPARQSPGAAPTGGKRNDRAYYAFKRYLEEAEPAGAPRAVLVAGGWGDGPQVVRGATLVQQLGIGHRTVWLPPQPKYRMRALYRACDVVLDQFDGACGSFGTVTAEALSCGKPVITHIDPDAHAWCRKDMPVPPHCQALTAPEIYDWLVQLARQPAQRERHGLRGRRWVEQYHSWRHVAEAHLALYARVLDVAPAAFLPPPELELEPAVDASDTLPLGTEVVWTDVGPVGVPAGLPAGSSGVPVLDAAGG